MDTYRFYNSVCTLLESPVDRLFVLIETHILVGCTSMRVVSWISGRMFRILHVFIDLIERSRPVCDKRGHSFNNQTDERTSEKTGSLIQLR